MWITIVYLLAFSLSGMVSYKNGIAKVSKKNRINYNQSLISETYLIYKTIFSITINMYQIVPTHLFILNDKINELNHL